MSILRQTGASALLFIASLNMAEPVPTTPVPVSASTATSMVQVVTRISRVKSV